MNDEEREAIDAVRAYNKHGQRLSRDGPFGLGGCAVFEEFIRKGALIKPAPLVGDHDKFFGSCTIQTAKKKVPALIEHEFLTLEQCFHTKRAPKAYLAHIPPLAQEALRRKEIWEYHWSKATKELADWGDSYVNVDKRAEETLGWTYHEWFSISLTKCLPVGGQGSV